MNREVSAGGIIVFKSSRGWLLLLMKDLSGNWTFPKGKREEGEDTVETAIREIEEEVGVKHLTLIAELTPVSYWYHRGTSIKKTVHYYLFRSPICQKPKVQTEEGISDAKWVLWSEAQNMIGYPKTNTSLMAEAYSKIKIR